MTTKIHPALKGPNYRFSVASVQSIGGTPVLVDDWSPGSSGQTHTRNSVLPFINMTAGEFVLRHLRDEAQALPSLSLDESLQGEDLFEIAFAFLTTGISPAVLQVADLLRLLESKGKKIPEIRFGHSSLPY